MHASVLWDARAAAQRVTRFTTGKTFAEYEADDYFRSAVERQFEIIGEAFSQLSRLDPATAAAIPTLPRIVAFRNVLIHGYASVDNKLVWGVVETHLAPCARLLRASWQEAEQTEVLRAALASRRRRLATGRSDCSMMGSIARRGIDHDRS